MLRGNLNDLVAFLTSVKNAVLRRPLRSWAPRNPRSVTRRPDPLHRAQRYAASRGSCPAGPVRHLAGRFGERERDDAVRPNQTLAF